MSPLVPLGAVALVILWAVRAYFWPFAPCRWCEGTGRNKGSTSARFGVCKHCTGGRRQVLGSKTVHRSVRALTRRGKP